MHPLVAVGASYVVAASSPMVRLPIMAALGIAVSLAPFLIAPDERTARFLVSIFAGTLMLKMWDLHIGATRAVYPSLGESLRFFANIPSLVHRKAGFERQPGVRENVLGLLWSVPFYDDGLPPWLWLR